MAAKTTKAAAASAAQTDATASAEIDATAVQETPESAATVESGADSAVASPEPDTDPDADPDTDLDADTDADAAADADTAASVTPSDAVDVVVRSNRTVRHEGAKHDASALVTLPRADAERLKALGFVDYLDDLHEAAQKIQAVKVSVSGGVELKQE